MYPYNISSLNDFFTVANFATTELAAALLAPELVVEVNDASKLPTGRFIALLGTTELVIVASRSANTLTFEQRGAFGTLPQAWAANTQIAATMTREHYQLLRDGIIALQGQTFSYQQPVDGFAQVDPNPATVGQSFIVAAVAGGAFLGRENQIARYDGTAWRFIAPVGGYTAFVIAESRRFEFNGTEWRLLAGGVSAAAGNELVPGLDGLPFFRQFIQVEQVLTIAALNSLVLKSESRIYIVEENDKLYRWLSASDTFRELSKYELPELVPLLYIVADDAGLQTLPPSALADRNLYISQEFSRLYRYDTGASQFRLLNEQVRFLDNLAQIQALPFNEQNPVMIYCAKNTGFLYRFDPALGAEGEFVQIGGSPGSTPTLPVVRRFTSSGTYTPSAGILYAVVEGQGAGGAGPSASSNSTSTSVTSGGGAGGYFKTIVSAAQLGTGPRSITIGAGALASDGGNTTVQGIGTANGGQVGERQEIPQGSQNTVFRGLLYVARGGNPGGAVVNLGQVIVAKRGGIGGRGFIQNSAGSVDIIAYMRGHGGQSEFGSALDQGYNNASNNQNQSVVADPVSGDQYGAGGNGAFTVGNAGANGSAGVGGIVVITEYFQ